jgi:hypothetical protein
MACSLVHNIIDKWVEYNAQAGIDISLKDV